MLCMLGCASMCVWIYRADESSCVFIIIAIIVCCRCCVMCFFFTMHWWHTQLRVRTISKRPSVNTSSSKCTKSSMWTEELEDPKRLTDWMERGCHAEHSFCLYSFDDKIVVSFSLCVSLLFSHGHVNFSSLPLGQILMNECQSLAVKGETNTTHIDSRFFFALCKSAHFSFCSTKIWANPKIRTNLNQINLPLDWRQQEKSAQPNWCIETRFYRIKEIFI